LPSRGSFGARCRLVKGRSCASSVLNRGLCFRNCVPRVVFRVVFFVGAVVGDATDDFLRVVAASKSAFRISPIAFRLGCVVGLLAVGMPGLIDLPFGFDGWSTQLEIPSVVHLVCLLTGCNCKVFVVFLIGKARKPEDASRVGSSGISSKLVCDCLLKVLGLLGFDPLDFPDDLIFAW